MTAVLSFPRCVRCGHSELAHEINRKHVRTWCTVAGSDGKRCPCRKFLA